MNAPEPLPLFDRDRPTPPASTTKRARPESSAPSTLDGMPLVLTVSEAAMVLRIGRTTAYKLAEEWRRSGNRRGLPTVQLGSRVMVRRVDLEAMLTTPATPPDAA